MPPRGSIECLSSKEFLAKEFPRQLYLCEPCIPLGGTVMLHGKRAVGKTAFALTIANSILRGEAFLDLYPCFAGPVVYIQIDMPARLQQERMKRFNMAHDDFHIIVSDSNIDILAEAKFSSNPWVRWLQELKPVLTIVDTLRKSHSEDENSSDTPVKVLGAWRDIIGPDCTLMFLHHDRKSFEGENQDEAARGSGAWLDEIDTAIHLVGKHKRLAYMDFTKLRTMDYPQPVSLRLSPETLLVEVDGRKQVDIWLDSEMKKQRYSREFLAKESQNLARWQPALSKATAYRKLENYTEPTHPKDESHKVASLTPVRLAKSNAAST